MGVGKSKLIIDQVSAICQQKNDDGQIDEILVLQCYSDFSKSRQSDWRWDILW